MDEEEKFYSCFLEKNFNDVAVQTKIELLPADKAYVGCNINGYIVTTVFNRVTAGKNSEFVTGWQLPKE